MCSRDAHCLTHMQGKALKHIKDTSRASQDLMGKIMPKRLLRLSAESRVEMVY